MPVDATPGAGELDECVALAQRIAEFFARGTFSQLLVEPAFSGCGWIDETRGMSLRTGPCSSSRPANDTSEASTTRGMTGDSPGTRYPRGRVASCSSGSCAGAICALFTAVSLGFERRIAA
jgi:hypothetical protein